ncbi:MAG: M23 family metallopeptidase [Candidatus Dojkabacteria bacterium]
MLRKILKISFTFCFFFLSQNCCFANVILISPEVNQTLTEENFLFKVQNTSDIEYVYKFVYFLYSDNALTTSFYKEVSVPEAILNFKYRDHAKYGWYVEYHPKDTFKREYDFRTETSAFGFNYVIPTPEEEIIEEDKALPKEEVKETIQPKVVKEKKVEKIEVKVEAPQAVKKSTIAEKKETSPQNELEWNVTSSTKEVLGTTDTNDIVCKFKYYKRRNSPSKEYCNIPALKILSTESYPFANMYSTMISGILEREIKIQIDEYGCDFNVFNPSTWFSCKEKFLNSTILDINPNVLMRIYEGDRVIPIGSYTLNQNSFDLLAGHSKDIKSLVLIGTYRIVNSKYKIFEDLVQEYPLKPTLYGLEENISKKPFSFPFNKTIGVTQWYGDTEYQKPHTGIDFGATKELVLAVGKGEVVSKGIDRDGECNSGGKYMIVKQKNGMYTGYFHLEETYVNVGDLVKAGDSLAKSGNSGAWNCQKLGYHLHFVTRKNRNTNSHVNPVPYINADWNNILTLGSKQYPGRLTGENPHPGK